MPQWGRPPGAGVGKYMEEMDDVYRFQEVDSDDEKNGVSLDSGPYRVPSGKQFNPDELYFNDMDLRAWERRTADVDGLAYGDDYGYQEDEGYYDDGTGGSMTPSEYEEFLFQRVLDKIRFARATGDPDVQLTQEELAVYQTRLLRPWAPAARSPAKARPVSAPIASGGTNTALANTSSNTANQGSSSTRSKKSQQRASLFSSRPKKPSSRKRSDSNVSKLSNVSETTSNQPPGFIVPGPNGQPVFAPISALNGRPGMARDASMRPGTGSPSRPGSRSASMSSRQAPSPRGTPPRDLPGAFPSGSPVRAFREPTPPMRQRPSSSSSSRQSSLPDVGAPTASGTRLVLNPVTDYQHYTAEPYQYFTPGAPQPSQAQASASQPQYARRVVSGPADGNYTQMPRRVPVPVQRVAPGVGFQGSTSDPILPRPAVQREPSDDVLVDVIPENDGYKVQTKASSSSSARDGDRRRRSGRSRRK